MAQCLSPAPGHRGARRATVAVLAYALAGCGLSAPTGGAPQGQPAAITVAPGVTATYDQGGQPVVLPGGNATCVNSPARVILVGTEPTMDPSVMPLLQTALETHGEPVAYTDGVSTITLSPPER